MTVQLTPLGIRATLEGKTDQEIMAMALKYYANPSTWEDWEKDMGSSGNMSVFPASIYKDRGDYARQCLDFIKERKSHDV